MFALQCRVIAAGRHIICRHYNREAKILRHQTILHSCVAANHIHGQSYLPYRNFGQSLNKNGDSGQFKTSGYECYKLAMEALQNAASAKQAVEEQLLREQFKAMERQREKTHQRRNGSKQQSKDPRLQRLNAIDANDDKSGVNDRAAGVAVVRTIVKQTRQSSVHVDKWDCQTSQDDTNNSDKDEDYYQQQALQYLEEAALRFGHPLALVRLGNEALERSKKSSTSLDRPLIDFERCKDWLDESQIDLIRILETIGNGEGDKDLAHLLYEEAGKAGSAEAWYNLGHLLWDSSDAEEVTTVEALEVFQKAVDLGDLDAMYFLGAQKLLQEEDEAGYELLRRAAKEQHGPALHHLALLSLQEGNEDEFQKLLTRAVEAGHPDSLFLQGHCFYHGEDGYEFDIKAALNSFLEAAENYQHVDAIVSAGAILHRGGNGIKRDQRRAFELYQQAGELGSTEGWRNVVACYARGEGVKKDIDMAKYIAKTMCNDDIR